MGERIWRGWLCGAHSASLHLNVKVPSAARRKLLFCIRKLMIASELCFWRRAFLSTDGRTASRVARRVPPRFRTDGTELRASGKISHKRNRRLSRNRSCSPERVRQLINSGCHTPRAAINRTYPNHTSLIVINILIGCSLSAKYNRVAPVNELNGSTAN